MTRIAGRRCIMAIITAAQGATTPMDLTILSFKPQSFVVAVIMSGGVELRVSTVNSVSRAGVMAVLRIGTVLVLLWLHV